MAQYKTKVYLTCSSSKKAYTFAFDYINKRYVKARINNTQELQWGTDYTVSGHTLTLVNSPTDGALMEIYRETPSDRTVEWYDSSILRAKDLNLYNTQLLHINEENIDKLTDSGIQEDKIDKKWDARFKNIKNVKEPTEDSEAVNLGWLKKTQESYLRASQAKVDEATSQANRSTNEADRAKREADRAQQQANRSETQAGLSESSATVSREQAELATSKANSASASATSASTSLTNTLASEKRGTDKWTLVEQASDKFTEQARVVDVQYSTVVSTAVVVEDNKNTAVANAETAISNAQVAITQASTATSSATVATTQATSASTSARNALSSSNSASTSASRALSSANRANTYATTSVSSASTATSSATLATQKATASESSATLSKYYAEQAKEASGGDYITTTTFNEAIDEVGTMFTTAINSHDTDVNAHGGLIANINKELGNKVDTTYFSNVLNEMEALIGSKASQEEFNSWGEGVATIIETKADKDTVKVLQNELEGVATATSYELEKTKTELDTKMPKSGGTFSSNPNVKSGDFSAISFENTAGKKLIIEGKPDSRDIIASIFLRDEATGTNPFYYDFPKKTGRVAVLSDRTTIDGKVGNTRLWDIFHRYGSNPNWVGKSSVDWNKLGVCITNFSQLDRFEQQPQQYGQLINIPYSSPDGGSECTQLWIDQSSGDIRIRGTNSTAELRTVGFKRLLRAEEIANRRVVINSWHNSSNGQYWREWSDGWLEQGGIIASNSDYNTISYHRAFRNLPIVTATVVSKTRWLSAYSANPSIMHVTATNFKVAIKDTDDIHGWYWKAEGYKA